MLAASVAGAAFFVCLTLTNTCNFLTIRLSSQRRLIEEPKMDEIFNESIMLAVFEVFLKNPRAVYVHDYELGHPTIKRGRSDKYNLSTTI